MLEAYATELGWLATIFGSLLAIAYFPQVYKIYKRKSVEDISIIMFGTALPALIIWLLYGLSINNTALIIANIIAVIGCSTIIIQYMIYKK